MRGQPGATELPGVTERLPQTAKPGAPTKPGHTARREPGPGLCCPRLRLLLRLPLTLMFLFCPFLLSSSVQGPHRGGNETSSICTSQKDGGRDGAKGSGEPTSCPPGGPCLSGAPAVGPTRPEHVSGTQGTRGRDRANPGLGGRPSVPAAGAGPSALGVTSMRPPSGGVPRTYHLSGASRGWASPQAHLVHHVNLQTVSCRPEPPGGRGHAGCASGRGLAGPRTEAAPSWVSQVGNESRLLAAQDHHGWSGHLPLCQEQIAVVGSSEGSWELPPKNPRPPVCLWECAHVPERRLRSLQSPGPGGQQAGV